MSEPRTFQLGGEGPRTSGGGGRGQAEWIAEDVNFTVEIVNVAGAAKKVSLMLEVYEED